MNTLSIVTGIHTVVHIKQQQVSVAGKDREAPHTPKTPTLLGQVIAVRPTVHLTLLTELSGGDTLALC